MKTILSTVRGWVFIGVILGSGGAWGQAELRIELPSNCAYFPEENRYGGTRVTVVHKAEGRCVDGLASGEWIIGITSSRIGGKDPREPSDFVQINTFQGGRANGIQIFLRRNGGLLYVTDQTTGPRTHFSNALNGIKFDNFSVISKSIDDAMRVAEQRNIPTAAASYYKNILSEWHKDNINFVDKWLSTASSSQPSNSQGSTRDDPKVFGRSARGG